MTPEKTQEAQITERVLQSFTATPDPRLRELMAALVRHLHAFVSEMEPSEAEWQTAIEFLTATGQMCDGHVRQEFILLSDVLGVSMLVDAINHRHSGAATDTTVFGPFYIAGMPQRQYGENMAKTKGEPALLHGRVLAADGRPLPNAVLDAWQAAANGMYSGQDAEQPPDNLRGRYRTDAEGRYAIRTTIPVSYPIPTDGPVGWLLDATRRDPWRPAHIHFLIEAEGHRRLVTHLFLDEDPYLASDAVFGVKESLKVGFRECPAEHPLASEFGFEQPFRVAHYDFVLEEA
ncbi:intradiol ring-cleavage dioxygenase [Halomonas alkalicola]|uniref:intradiol ring-cleavage dioxygenase n=1 Tax=Halomonas alkalicola TaxID=1930622 RepID=UPI00265FA27A|nr:intradiol ring-cleavage dioxygenase [Halomonas alkalicola]